MLVFFHFYYSSYNYVVFDESEQTIVNSFQYGFLVNPPVLFDYFDNSFF